MDTASGNKNVKQFLTLIPTTYLPNGSMKQFVVKFYWCLFEIDQNKRKRYRGWPIHQTFDASFKALEVLWKNCSIPSGQIGTITGCVVIIARTELTQATSNGLLIFSRMCKANIYLRPNRCFRYTSEGSWNRNQVIE